MEKLSHEMDLEEWDLLSDDGLLDFHHEDGKKLFSKDAGFDPKGILDMNYFICPSPRTSNRRLLGGSNSVVSVPICLDPAIEKNPDRELVKEILKVPIVDIKVVPPGILDKIKASDIVADQDMISQVFFKKMKENEFVDMKMDSPKSNSRGIKSQIEVGSIQFEEKEEARKCEESEDKPLKKVIEEETGKDYMGTEIKEDGCWEGGGLSIWRWRLTGIGALCSIGVAAATICIFIFGSQQRPKQQHQNQKLQIQIYTEDKIEPGTFDYERSSSREGAYNFWRLL
eukprot:TRINITY_DN561_c0_g1_i1.p1 TRINITY_DN561_c0_g1~~TRINITY_DN561_c0_g1_i1.p1  ORF type:complete len:284 (-),score=57.65 TRINITY_DN561_c0_g1_i1:235-1086(-)